MFLLNIVLVACAILFTCDAAFVDTLTKCSIKDDECVRSSYEGVIRSIGKEGIPEINVPPIDPMRLTNLSITVLDAVKITVDEGIIKGISKCAVKKYHIDIDKLTCMQEVECDLTIKGQISVTGQSPLIQNLLGSASINTQGKGKVKLDKLNLNVVFPILPYKKDDGEIYFKSVQKDVQMKYDIEKASFAIEKIFVGNNDISPIVATYLNENWRSLLKSLGPVFVEKAMEIYIDFTKGFFRGIPAKNYIIEDLTPYVNLE